MLAIVMGRGVCEHFARARATVNVLLSLNSLGSFQSTTFASQNPRPVRPAAQSQPPPATPKSIAKQGSVMQSTGITTKTLPKSLPPRTAPAAAKNMQSSIMQRTLTTPKTSNVISPKTAPTASKNVDPLNQDAAHTSSVKSRGLDLSSSIQQLTQTIDALNRRIVKVEGTNRSIDERLTNLENLASSIDARVQSMEQVQNSMHKMLKDMTRRNSPKVRTKPDCFPFRSIADLLQFDNTTDELFDDVVNYLAYLGGANCDDEANFYFKSSFEFDEDLFRNLSWHGSKNDFTKVALNSTRFATACESAMNLNRDALEKPTREKFSIAMTKAIKNAKESYRRKRAAADPRKRPANIPLEGQPPRQRVRVLLPKNANPPVDKQPQDEEGQEPNQCQDDVYGNGNEAANEEQQEEEDYRSDNGEGDDMFARTSRNQLTKIISRRNYIR